MYIETADWNYLAGRDAFIGGRYWDFWWLTNHALEKYLKALLLLNGLRPLDNKHSPSALLSEVLQVDARLTPAHPPEPKIRGLHHWPSNYRSFLVLLERQGSPSNRYGTYGFAVEHGHLLQADHLIYWARRHARVLTSNAAGEQADWIDSLDADHSFWTLLSNGPLERLAAFPHASKKRQMFSRLNTAFFPEIRHRLRGFPVAFHNAPIYLARERLMGSAAGSDTRKETRALLAWVLDNISLLKDEKADLRNLLSRYT